MNREKLFTKIITQVSAGHEEEYAELAKEIEQREEMQLIPNYQEILDNLKDNPLDEKEIAEIIEDASNKKISQFEIAAKVLGKEFVKADDMEQVALLIAKVTHKILDFRDNNSVLKKTDKFAEYEPMKPSDRMKFETLKIQEEKLSGDESAKKTKEINKFITKATNVEVDELSTWERGLLGEILAQEAKGISNIFLGKK